MPLYIVLYKFTEEGRKNIKATVRRATQVERENARRGFRVVGTWWTTGQYDLVSVVNAPSEAAMMGGLYNIAEAGNVSSETLRAYSSGEMRKALSSAGPSSAAPARKRAARRRPARKAAARKRIARKTGARKRPARKAAARKRPARKAAARKRPVARRRPARKTARRRTAVRRRR